MKTRSKTLEDKYETWNIISNVEDNPSKTLSKKSALRDLKKNLTNPVSQISFSGIDKIYKYYDKVISKNEIRNILSTYDFYTLHAKSFRKKNNPSFIKYKFQQLQIDLIDVSTLSKHNGGNNFLLSAICSFTKKAWLYPLKSKSSKEVLFGFKQILKKAQKIPSSILSDSGKEFRNKEFLNFCMENNIKTYEAFSSFHGAIVERFNQ